LRDEATCTNGISFAPVFSPQNAKMSSAEARLLLIFYSVRFFFGALAGVPSILIL